MFLSWKKNMRKILAESIRCWELKYIAYQHNYQRQWWCLKWMTNEKEKKWNRNTSTKQVLILTSESDQVRFIINYYQMWYVVAVRFFFFFSMTFEIQFFDVMYSYFAHCKKNVSEKKKPKSSFIWNYVETKRKIWNYFDEGIKSFSDLTKLKRDIEF